MSYYLYEPDKVGFEQFVVNSLKESGIKKNLPMAKKLQDIVNPDFDNVLYIDGNEVYFEKVKNEEGPAYYLFKINKLPEKVNVRFGCELETCFILNCSTGEAGVEEAQKYKPKGNTWDEGVIYHLRTNIIPYLSDEFKKRFTYAFVKGYHAEEGNYLDLRNGNLVSDSIASDEYKTLRFEPDSSIKCDEVAGQVPYPCEIISPILSSIKEIELLYKGLRIDESCAQSNKSMGFHVNVSGVDENGKMIELTRGMQTELLYGWLPYEKKNYRALRGEGSGYAAKLEDVVNSKDNMEFVDAFIKNKNGEEINNYEYFAPYGLNIWYTRRFINEYKFLSMTHWKKNNVIEFRVFPSKNNLSLLLNYAKDAMKVFQSSIQSYLDTPEKTLMNLQKTYLMYKYVNTEIPLQKFEGSNDAWFNVKMMYDITESPWMYRKKKSWFFPEEIEFKFITYEECNRILKYKVGDTYRYFSYTYYLGSDVIRDILVNKMSNPVEISEAEVEELKSKARKSKNYKQFWDKF